jgi:hypothetical protein
VPDCESTVKVCISSAFISYCSITEASRVGLLKFDWKSLMVSLEIRFYYGFIVERLRFLELISLFCALLN